MQTKRPTASGDTDSSREASTVSSAAVSTDEILSTSPDVFRVALSHISRDDEPAKWAVEQLKLGARLRVEAGSLAGAQRTHVIFQAAKAFEEALCFYCDLVPEPTTREQSPVASDASPAEVSEPDSNDVGIDLVLEVVQRTDLNDSSALNAALEIFAEGCTDEVRTKDFRRWLSAGLNRGCALILLGKMSESPTGSELLHLAVDGYHYLLSEPVLHQLRQECALVYINLAEALGSLSERRDTEDDSPYLAGAMESLATALWQTVPEPYRPLVAPKPAEFN